METYLITYKLVVKDGPNQGRSRCTVSDIRLTVKNKEDVLLTLKRMYPMYDIDLTTCNIVRPVCELSLSKNKQGWYFIGVTVIMPSGERRFFCSMVTAEYAEKCGKENNLEIINA